MTTGERPSYAGDVSAMEAWDLLSAEANAVLVDVRTTPEWNFVGVVDLSPLGKTPLLLEWQQWPAMSVNGSFVSDLTSRLGELAIGPDAPVLFLCRSGARSLAAAVAMTAAGWSRALNIRGGFEGPLDAVRHRGSSDGWKAAGLPWAQS